MLRCRQNYPAQIFSLNSALQSGRIVFFKGNPKYVEPVMNLQEFLKQQEAEGVTQEHQNHENYHGFNITDDQSIETARLGIREDLAANMERFHPHRKAGLQVLDSRITQRLREVVGRKMSLDRQKMGLLDKMWVGGKGFMRNCLSIVRPDNPYRQKAGFVTSLMASDVDNQLEKIYGHNLNIENVRVKLAQDVWDQLSPAHRALVSADLLARGVAIPAATGNVRPQVMQMAAADPDQLAEMRAALSIPSVGVFSPLALGENPLYPMTQEVLPDTPIDRLIGVRQIEALERKKLLSTTIYDTRRLQMFLDQMRNAHHDLHEQITKILDANALYPLENNPEAQALVAYLEYRWQRRGPDDLRAELKEIEEKLPLEAEKKHDDHGAKSDEHAKDEHGHDKKDEHGKKGEEHHDMTPDEHHLHKVKELMKQVKEQNAKLGALYNQADAQGAELYDLKKDLFHLAQPTVTTADGRGSKAANIDVGHKDLAAEITKTRSEKKRLRQEISTMEREYQNGSRELMDILHHKLPKLPEKKDHNDPYDQYREFSKKFGHHGSINALSTEEQLFGITDYPPPKVAVKKEETPIERPKTNLSELQDHIKAFKPSQMEVLEEEVKTNFHKLFKKKERVSPRRLLYLLKVGDLTRQGITNEEQRRKWAYLSANLAISSAADVQINRSTNLEVAEDLGDTFLTFRKFKRAGKWMKAKLNMKGMYEAEDVINYVAGFDKEFKMFRGMKKDITLAELRDLIDRNGGINPLKLVEFRTKLTEVLKSFEALSSQGKVQLYDRDAVSLEELDHKIDILGKQDLSDKFFQEIRDFKGSKAEAILKKMKEEETTILQEEKSLMEKLRDKGADWKRLFSRKALKHQYLEKIMEAREKMKKMNRQERKEMLQNDGLATAYDVLKTGIAAKEILDIGTAVGKWSWNGIKGGTHFTYDSGKGVLHSAWSNIAAPIGRNVVYKPAKFVLWDAPAWGLDKAAKLVGLPFRLVGKLVDTAWSFGKGGGGHGGGGGHAAPAAHH